MCVCVTAKENNSVNLHNIVKPSGKFCIKYSIPSHSVVNNRAWLLSLIFYYYTGRINKFLVVFTRILKIAALKQTFKYKILRKLLCA